MRTNDKSETPISRAIKRRKELQDGIRKHLQEIEKIDIFLSSYRQYSGIDSAGVNQDSGTEPPGLGRAGHGLTQAMFENLARDILRERGEPMQSNEFVEAFRERGHPIGGTNESKQAWNRLWKAKVNGKLVHFPKPGYWLADEPIPESASVKNKAAVQAGLMEKPQPKGSGHKYKGRPVGRPATVTEGQIETAKQWLLEGDKTLAQIGIDLGGVSIGTLRLRLGDLIKELREKRGTKAGKMRDEIEAALKAGKSVKQIAEERGVSPPTIYRALSGGAAGLLPRKQARRQASRKPARGKTR